MVIALWVYLPGGIVASFERHNPPESCADNAFGFQLAIGKLIAEFEDSQGITVDLTAIAERVSSDRLDRYMRRGPQ